MTSATQTLSDRTEFGPNPSELQRLLAEVQRQHQFAAEDQQAATAAAAVKRQRVDDSSGTAAANNVFGLLGSAGEQAASQPNVEHGGLNALLPPAAT